MCCCGGGTDHDHHEQGMISQERRSCTDLPALLFFFIFCGGLGAISMYGFTGGDPYRIFYGADSFGNTCGRVNEPLVPLLETNIRVPLSGGNMTAKRKLFPLTVSKPFSTLWVCVEDCPSTAIVTYEQVASSNVSLCVDEASSKAAPLHSHDGRCPSLPVYPSKSIINRCIPRDILRFGNELAQEIVSHIKDIDWVRSILDSVVLALPAIGKAVLAAIGLSLLVMFLLRFLAPVAVYFVYLLVVLVFCSISGGLWYGWWRAFGESRLNVTPATSPLDHRRTVADYTVFEDATFIKNAEAADLKDSLSTLLEKPTVSEGAFLGLALGSTVITVATVVLMWCLLPRAELIVRLFKQAGSALASMPFLLLQPLITAVAVLLISAYSLGSALLVHSAAEPIPRVLNDSTNFTVITYTVSETQKYMLMYQFAGFIWLVELAFAYQRMLVVGAVATWYFDKSCSSPVCRSRWNTIRYHMGSIALGSFIITLVRLPRLFLMYIYAKMKATENAVVLGLLSCCICCLGCVEKCLEYINYNAYTIIAYTGHSFCPAAKTAVNVLLDNAVDAATLNSVGDFVLFLAKAAVAACSSFFCFFLLKDIESLPSWWPPLLVVAILSYQVANCFISVYEMVMDALFLCIADDSSMEREGVSPRRNPEMMEYMERTLSMEATPRRNGKGRREENIPLQARNY